jgi:hypothetical protein
MQNRAEISKITKIVQPSFYIACSRFLPGTNMKTAAHLMHLHMHHHLKLGFQARPQAPPLVP